MKPKNYKNLTFEDAVELFKNLMEIITSKLMELHYGDCIIVSHLDKTDAIDKTYAIQAFHFLSPSLVG